MVYQTIHFDDGRAYVGNRPVGDGHLLGPGGPHGSRIAFVALVDTGADFMHLPTQSAAAVGVSLANARQITISTAGGIITVLQEDVDVEIEGVTVNIPVNFAHNAKPLIGRQAIFKVLESTGFTTTEWLLRWKQRPPSATQSAQEEVEALMARADDSNQIIEEEDYVVIGGFRLRKNH